MTEALRELIQARELLFELAYRDIKIRYKQTLLGTAWAVATPALWALGWLITSQVIVDAERQHAVFGSSGALLVSAVAGLLVVVRGPAESTIARSIVSQVAGVR